MPISYNWNVKGVGRDHRTIVVKEKGDLRTQIMVSTNVHYWILRQNVFYVPSISVNLSFMYKATDRGMKAVFKKESLNLSTFTVETIRKPERLLKQISINSISWLCFQRHHNRRLHHQLYPCRILVAFLAISLNIWHRCFGHEPCTHKGNGGRKFGHRSLSIKWPNSS